MKKPVWIAALVVTSLFFGSLNNSSHELRADEKSSDTAIKVSWVKIYIPEKAKKWPSNRAFESIPKGELVGPQVFPTSFLALDDGILVAFRGEWYGNNERFLGLMKIGFDGKLIWERYFQADVNSLEMTGGISAIAKIKNGFILLISQFGQIGINKKGHQKWVKEQPASLRPGDSIAVTYRNYIQVLSPNGLQRDNTIRWANQTTVSHKGELLESPRFLNISLPIMARLTRSRVTRIQNKWLLSATQTKNNNIIYACFSNKGKLIWKSIIKGEKYNPVKILDTSDGYMAVGSFNDFTQRRDLPTIISLRGLTKNGKVLSEHKIPLKKNVYIRDAKKGSSGFYILAEDYESMKIKDYRKSYYAVLKDKSYLVQMNSKYRLVTTLELVKPDFGKPFTLIMTKKGLFMISGNNFLAPNVAGLHITKFGFK